MLNKIKQEDNYKEIKEAVENARINAKKETNEKPPVSGKKTGAGRFFLPEKPEKTIRNL